MPTLFHRSHSCLVHNNDPALIWLPNNVCFPSVCSVSEKFKPLNVYFVPNYANFPRTALTPLPAVQLIENITFILAQIL